LRAHGEGAVFGPGWWRIWDFDPLTVVSLFVAGALYVSGLRCLRAATGRTRKLRREATYFGAGWVVLVIALLSPVHPLGSVLFSMHMTQHELLMVIAAPLVVLGRPVTVMLWAFPKASARRVLTGLRQAGLGRVWHWSTNAFWATLVHAVALWVWHVPVLFEATLGSEAVHAAQHVMFFGTAVMFWQAVLFGERRAADYGLAVLFLFLTAMHSGALGALITFASTPWYATYAAVSGAGLTPLEDQQLGGLIMWIPAGMIYVVAGLVLFAAWLRESDRRALKRRAQAEGEAKCAAVL
jgi:putative membrane protein